MTPSESKDISTEIEFLRAWCITVLQYYVELLNDSNLKAIWQSTIEHLETFNAPTKNLTLKGLQTAFRDTISFIRDLPADDLTKLNAILKKQFGRDFSDIDTQKDIQRIVKRGHITNDEEYRMLDEVVNDLSQSSPQSGQIELYNTLLTKYTLSR